MRRGPMSVRAGTKSQAQTVVTMIFTIGLMLPLGGCLLAGDKPEPGLDIPPAYDGGPRNEAAAEAAVPPLDWWRMFRSRELTDIIEEARAANLDIAAAIARIVQADAQARIAGSALLPNVDAQRQRHALALIADARRFVRLILRRLGTRQSLHRRSPPATKSTSGARTAPPCARPSKPRSPAATTAKWWA